MPAQAPLDRRRPSLQHPARALADVLRRHAPSLLWRALHPLQRSSFAEGAPLPPAERADVCTVDGWQLPVFALPMRPGASGEPVLLLHTLGLGPDAFRYGREGTLAAELIAGGFRVYTACVRGDRESVPAAPRAPVRFDEMATYDLPALVSAVLDHARASRCHVVGHGFGGQLALGWVARCGDAPLASLAVLSSPVRFAGGQAALGPSWQVSRLLPSHLRAPTRRLARLAAPWLNPGGEQGSRGADPGPRLRGALCEATEDIPAGLVRQLLTWYREGALVDGEGVLDYGVALRAARAPLWVGVAPDDTWCPPDAVLPLLGLWGEAPVEVHECPAGFGHLDLLLHPDARAQVFAPLVGWLARQRARAWSRELPSPVGAQLGR